MSECISMTLLEFFRGCRRPLYYKSTINKLRNHETLSLGGVRQSIGKHRFAYGQAYIQKQTKGQYSFVGLWTLPTKPERQDIWVQGTFTLSKGVMRFEKGVTSEHLRGFFKVCRYLGVHKRVCVTRYRYANKAYRQAQLYWQQQWQASEEEYCTHPDPAWFEEMVASALGPEPSKKDFGCWFLVHDYSPLFDGEVIKPYFFDLSRLDFDTQDRMVTSPWCALEQKAEIR